MNKEVKMKLNETSIKKIEYIDTILKTNNKAKAVSESVILTSEILEKMLYF